MIPCIIRRAATEVPQMPAWSGMAIQTSTGSARIGRKGGERTRSLSTVLMPIQVMAQWQYWFCVPDFPSCHVLPLKVELR